MSQLEHEKQSVFMWATSLASVPANIIGRLVSYPLDTIKSKAQINRTAIRTLSEFKGVKNIIHNTWQQEGIAGFYRGGSISIFGSIIAYHFYIRTYETSKIWADSFLQGFLSHMLAGFMAELVSSALWLPIDVIKERMQAYGATILLFGPFSAIFFAVYEELKQLLNPSSKDGVVYPIVCSAGASCVAGLLTTPLEVVKLRMQVQRADIALHGGTLEQSVFGYRHVFHGLTELIAKEGVLAMFKGSLLRMCSVVPNVSLTIGLTEYFRQQLIPIL